MTLLEALFFIYPAILAVLLYQNQRKNRALLSLATFISSVPALLIFLIMMRIINTLF
ncbi:hypothetical protein [Jeotgalibacillus proteolyticus]|uniref:hypothetical protein n=1 Tax=Jeotgalibacillus proteolyticus TaxID=2082395 RepID=UPI003CED4207